MPEAGSFNRIADVALAVGRRRWHVLIRGRQLEEAAEVVEQRRTVADAGTRGIHVCRASSVFGAAVGVEVEHRRRVEFERNQSLAVVEAYEGPVGMRCYVCESAGSIAADSVAVNCV